RRNLVDVEPEPIRKQHDLRRDRRARIVVVLPEETEIKLGEGVDLGDATHLQDLGPGLLQRRMARGIAGKLQAEIALDRRADIGGTAFEDAPTAVLILLPQDVASGLGKT